MLFLTINLFEFKKNRPQTKVIMGYLLEKKDLLIERPVHKRMYQVDSKASVVVVNKIIIKKLYFKN